MLSRTIFQRAAPARRAFSTSLRIANDNQPQFIREGPTGLKSDPQRFDNGSDDPHYPGTKEKMKARNDPYPNRPTATQPKPEPEMPHGQEGAFADHRGKGDRVDGEHLTGSEEAIETRTTARVGQMAKNAAKSLFGSSDKKSFSTYSVVRSGKAPLEPTQGDRQTPANSAKGSLSEHPGYTTMDAPIDSSHPKDMPKAPEGAVPSSSVTNASTKASPPHPDVHGMAKGAEQPGAGQDAILPEDRSQQTWGANARSAQFNENEGQRQPLRDGGSHEGGFKGKSDGKSRT